MLCAVSILPEARSQHPGGGVHIRGVETLIVGTTPSYSNSIKFIAAAKYSKASRTGPAASEVSEHCWIAGAAAPGPDW